MGSFSPLCVCLLHFKISSTSLQLTSRNTGVYKGPPQPLIWNVEIQKLLHLQHTRWAAKAGLLHQEAACGLHVSVHVKVHTFPCRIIHVLH